MAPEFPVQMGQTMVRIGSAALPGEFGIVVTCSGRYRAFRAAALLSLMGGPANRRNETMVSAFVQSATILLREGLEALLVIAALAAYFRKSGAQQRLAALYWGAGPAIIASIVAARLFDSFINCCH